MNKTNMKMCGKDSWDSDTDISKRQGGKSGFHSAKVNVSLRPLLDNLGIARMTNPKV